MKTLIYLRFQLIQVPRLWLYLRIQLLLLPSFCWVIGEDVDTEIDKAIVHYYYQLRSLNPTKPFEPGYIPSPSVEKFRQSLMRRVPVKYYREQLKIR